jgi:hypothetical protein
MSGSTAPQSSHVFMLCSVTTLLSALLTKRIKFYQNYSSGFGGKIWLQRITSCLLYTMSLPPTPSVDLRVSEHAERQALTSFVYKSWRRTRLTITPCRNLILATVISPLWHNNNYISYTTSINVRLIHETKSLNIHQCEKCFEQESRRKVKHAFSCLQLPG